MSIYYITSEELENEVFQEDQNIVNIDDLSPEEKEFVKKIMDYVPLF